MIFLYQIQFHPKTAYYISRIGKKDTFGGEILALLHINAQQANLLKYATSNYKFIIKLHCSHGSKIVLFNF